ncbi:hypothetical protein Ciccas_004317, partial [Cichlidogyrus casuarinus]
DILVKEFPKATVLLVAHRLSNIIRICDEVLVLSQGCVVETGIPSQLLQDPKSYLARAATSANLL